LKFVKVLFVDEAQDLNQLQYDIIVRLKELLKLTVYMVGDPNQSIYGFRGSNPSYLISFPGKQYTLTKNFRSPESLVSFSEFLKPHPQYKSVSALSVDGKKPHVLHAPFHEFQTFLKAYIEKYDHDLSDLAIMCPTKGNRMNAQGKMIGLARVANMLHSMDIPFVQLYNETGSTDGSSVKYGRKPGHVNLLTYHGSKGQEWDSVVCADMWFDLMNRKPTKTQHKENQALLFVATTRAKDNLIIFAENTREPNSWLNEIPMHKYDGFLYAKETPTTFQQDTEDKPITGVRDMIDNLTSTDLLDIEARLEYKISTRSLWPDFRRTAARVVHHDQALLGEFLENLFSLQCALHRKDMPRSLPVIETIISGKTVIVSPSQYSIVYGLWKECRSWNDYDQIKPTKPPWVLMLIEKNMQRSIPWDKHFITTSEFYKVIVSHQNLITKCYTNYKEKTTWKETLRDLFYLTVVTHSYNTNHIFHIKNYGFSKTHIMHSSLNPLFDYMNTFAQTFTHRQPYKEQKSVAFPYLNVVGVMDWQFQDGTIVEFKASQDSNKLHHILQLFAYAVADSAVYGDLIRRPCMLLNFLTGELSTVTFSVSEANMLPLFNLFAKASRQKLTRMSIVYDLETTGWIQGDYMPDIIQISMKDYQYEYFILRDQMVQLQNEPVVPEEIVMLTGLTQERVDSGIRIDELRERLANLLEYLKESCCFFIAHNGNRFDRPIMRNKDLWPGEYEHLDSQTIVRVFGNRPKGLKLKDVYQAYFGEMFEGEHTSAADVNAVTRILKHLGWKG
jgi:DNA polymerase III epsilon subunit-like protein